MRTDAETVKEAEETVTFIRKLQAQEAQIKADLKEKREEIDQALGHLTALFEAEENDDDRPLLDGQDGEEIPSSVTFTGPQLSAVKELGEQLRRPKGARGTKG